MGAACEAGLAAGVPRLCLLPKAPPRGAGSGEAGPAGGSLRQTLSA